jgi:hypothetical protein
MFESDVPGTDRVDRWLIQHYPPMSQAERDEVRDAVTTGQAVRDPALRAAAQGLAAELLSGRLPGRDRGLVGAAVLIAISGALSVAPP